MYFHLAVMILCWVTGIIFPSIPETYSLALKLMGFIALLLFFKDLIVNINNKFLIQAEDAEQEDKGNLSFFTGKFVMIRNEDSPFSDEFTFIIFNDGKMEKPLFCRNLGVIQKAVQANNDLIVYYKDSILVNVEEME